MNRCVCTQKPEFSSHDQQKGNQQHNIFMLSTTQTLELPCRNRHMLEHQLTVSDCLAFLTPSSHTLFLISDALGSCFHTLFASRRKSHFLWPSSMHLRPVELFDKDTHDSNTCGSSTWRRVYQFFCSPGKWDCLSRIEIVYQWGGEGGC